MKDMLLVLGVIMGWSVLTILLATILLDRPTLPAWRARYAYQWITLGLLLLLCFVSLKFLLYRAELRWLIHARHGI